MASPSSTVWEIEPRTKAKHEILRRYLQAWTPILTMGGFPQVLYIDGFAGPGRYSSGEDGSPIIALNTALERPIPIKTTVQFVFVEKDKDRAENLNGLIQDNSLPANVNTQVIIGTGMVQAFDEIQIKYGNRIGRLPPTFAFIDPFGWAGAPFSIVQEIMSNRSCEVLVTFMYEEINRFLGHKDQVENFDAFFGTGDWKAGVKLKGPRRRIRFLHDLYARQLREAANAKYVRSFEMKNKRDGVDYYLFHATNSFIGLKRMKEAMWKVDESGEFSFSDATNPNQHVLFAKSPNFDELERQLFEQFGGKTASVKEIEKFVVEKTAFRETHYKLQILRRLELASPPLIEAINPPLNRKRGTYGNETLELRFK